ncbi:SDR family oxidoreductase [Microbacterium album]|uniref:Short-chain dehydrogenase n=1 Tax=Microbacterium album TaxID=2053191 RepID=A0A917IFA3_9MICO|nr:SDR family oxidoreductase [Microbacterium album]GGH47424.1 short-chain dehydrogenase [Microbacterium album]
MNLQDEVVVITGGASGIGLATAKLSAKEGALVAILDRNLDAAKAAVKELPRPERHIAVGVDVSDSNSVEVAFATVLSRYGRIDVLCNNAGFGFRGSIEETPEEAWDQLMAVNLKGVFLCSRAAMPALKKTKGRIVNTSSYTAQMGIADRAAYVASKGGVSALTRAMALDHIADGVRVNAVAPGTVNSPYFADMVQKSEDPQGLLDSLNGRAPMGRMGEPEEIAEGIVWLASKRSAFATGSVVTLDGGTSIWGR